MSTDSNRAGGEAWLCMHIFSNKTTCAFQARLESQQQLESLLASPSQRGLGQQRSDGQGGRTRRGEGGCTAKAEVGHLPSRRECFGGSRRTDKGLRTGLRANV